MAGLPYSIPCCIASCSIISSTLSPILTPMERRAVILCRVVGDTITLNVMRAPDADLVGRPEPGRTPPLFSLFNFFAKL